MPYSSSAVEIEHAQSQNLFRISFPSSEIVRQANYAHIPNFLKLELGIAVQRVFAIFLLPGSLSAFSKLLQEGVRGY